MEQICLLTCPHCGHQSLDDVPAERGEEFRECDGCHETIAAKVGDCCVYKSFGDRPCSCAERVPLTVW